MKTLKEGLFMETIPRKCKLYDKQGGSKRQNKQNKQNENKQQNKQNEEKEKAK